ncbi:MAG: hypothetical protein M0R46_06920 [Candidatus Muirbacterium halophilum]|nr:hypothetical protein [Candidatus Muirbacterium halophilum]
MKILNYSQFNKLDFINEDVQRAKKLLKDRYLIDKISKELGFIDDRLQYELSHEGKRSLSLNDFNADQQKELKSKLREIKLTDQQVKDIERDPDFRKIRILTVELDNDNAKKYTLERDNTGWVYAFTYFYFIENITIEELKDAYKNLLEYKDLLDKLPKKFDSNFIDPTIPNNFEILIDGFEIIETYTYIRDLFNILNPKLKKQYKNASKIIKDKFDSVAVAFKELDEEQRKQDLKNIAKKMGRYNPNPNSKLEKNLKDFIEDIENFLKSANNAEMSDFLEKIEECNDKFGDFGADIKFNDKGILIIDVKSFNANVMLNSHTSHCIKNSQSTWDSYVPDDRKQYYIYNFNIPSYNNLSVIGVTIDIDHTIGYAHAKNDLNVKSELKSHLINIQKEYGITIDLFKKVLVPISPEEMERKRKSKEANIKLASKRLSIDKIKELIKDGGDINIDNSRQLYLAVSNNELFEKDVDEYHNTIEELLKLGASPVINDGNSIIDEAKDITVIKLLVNYGSDITEEAFNNIYDDPEAVEYCLKAGIDPNFGRKTFIRRCIKGSWESKENIGEPYYESIDLLVKYGATYLTKENFKTAVAYGRIKIIDDMIQKGYIDEVASKSKFGNISTIKDDYLDSFTKHINDKEMKKVIKHLDNLIDKYEK